MALQTTPAPAPAPVAYDQWRDRRWRLTGVAFAALCLVTAVLFVQLGEKRSDLNQLTASVSQGSVSQVEIVGLLQEPGWQGGSNAA